jgi:hypothetical protein
MNDLIDYTTKLHGQQALLRFIPGHAKADIYLIIAAAMAYERKVSL